ncbi:hypothetical protein BSLG_004995 [Batrachochytrium salamandrivorans]|nr:hypothetical protein BSLG_004995 [Batrachochytrium salamandrivorans]
MQRGTPVELSNKTQGGALGEADSEAQSGTLGATPCCAAFHHLEYSHEHSHEHSREHSHEHSHEHSPHLPSIGHWNHDNFDYIHNDDADHSPPSLLHWWSPWFLIDYAVLIAMTAVWLIVKHISPFGSVTESDLSNPDLQNPIYPEGNIINLAMLVILSMAAPGVIYLFITLLIFLGCNRLAKASITQQSTGSEWRVPPIIYISHSWFHNPITIPSRHLFRIPVALPHIPPGLCHMHSFNHSLQIP